MVYLIHFDTPYKQARHYLGCAGRLAPRIKEHRSGHGARLLDVLNKAGIGYEVVRTWSGGFDVEKKLKRQKNSPRYCPICAKAREHVVS